MKDGFLKVTAITTPIRVADCEYNVRQILDSLQTLPEETALAVFPELCLTGYSCGDLFLQTTLQQGAEEALRTLLNATADRDTVILAGLPVVCDSFLYNCAAVCFHGELLGLVPKKNIPTYSEFYEGRYFFSGEGIDQTLVFAGQNTRLCADVLFTCASLPEFRLGVEICEDVWVAGQPSICLASAGATVIANLSASDETIGKDDFRRELVKMQSARLCCAYIYADAGEGESTSDLVFSGHNLIAENGTVLAESTRFTTGAIATEFDLQRLIYDRRRITPFKSVVLPQIKFSLPIRPITLTRHIESHPFVPSDTQKKSKRCEDVLTIQAAGLSRRLQHTGSDAVIGLSGGLDSALALLVTVRAYRLLGRNSDGITAVTMPCFGTTDRTYRNACALATSCGVNLREVSIAAAVKQHFADIGHGGLPDITYENAQARERTQVLMDIANSLGALVIGTGDLSELALGWATYNGDHMSMYGVNASVPKTLVRYLVEYEAAHSSEEIRRVLTDILNTPVSPELLPPENGTISQKTEQIVGSYDLHDFFLYYMLRFGYTPSKIYRLALLAFDGEFSSVEIKKWLCIYLKRFFAQQFKRNCLPDGPKVGSVSLSPRGDWRMPSDASAALWLREAEKL